MFRTTALCMFGLLTLCIGEARAQLIFCNLTSSPITSAIGSVQGKTWSTVGWINLLPGKCRTVVRSRVGTTDFYVYAATSSDGSEIEPAGESTILCTSSQVFSITGTLDAESCSARKFDSHTFQRLQIDEAVVHTLSLSYGNAGRLRATLASSGKGDPKPALEPGAPNVPLDGLMEQILSRIETLVPPEVDNSQEWIPVADRVVVRYKVWRDHIRVVSRSDQVASGSVRIYYQAQAGMEIARRHDGNLTVVKLGSCGMDEPRIIDVPFVTELNLVGGDHYVPTTKLGPLSFINNCRPTKFKVDVSTRIRDVLQAEFQAFATSMDAHLIDTNTSDHTVSILRR